MKNIISTFCRAFVQAVRAGENRADRAVLQVVVAGIVGDRAVIHRTSAAQRTEDVGDG